MSILSQLKSSKNIYLSRNIAHLVAGTSFLFLLFFAILDRVNNNFISFRISLWLPILITLVAVTYTMVLNRLLPQRYLLAQSSIFSSPFILAVISSLVTFLSLGLLLFKLKNSSFWIPGIGALFVLAIVYTTLPKLKVQRSNKLPRYVKITHLVTLSFFLILVGYALYSNIVPNGTLAYHIDALHYDQTIQFGNSDKTIITNSSSGERSFLVTQDPLPISLYIPRGFDTAAVTITYKETAAQKGPLSLGTIHSSGALSWTPLTWYEPTFENLPPYWNTQKQNDFLLLQYLPNIRAVYDEKQAALDQELLTLTKAYQQQLATLDTSRSIGAITKVAYDEQVAKKKTQFEIDKSILVADFNKSISSVHPPYESVDSFLSSDSINYRTVAQYNTQVLEKTFRLTPEEKNRFVGEVFSTTNAVRGSFTLFVYQPHDGPFLAEFITRDSNFSKGPDTVELGMNYGGTRISQTSVGDDGNEDNNNTNGPARRLSLTKDFLPEGLYRIQLTTSIDVFTISANISSPFVAYDHDYYSGENNTFSNLLGRESVPPPTVYTNSLSLDAVAADESALQNITVNGLATGLDGVGLPKAIGGLKEEGENEVQTSYGGIKLSGDGLFSLRQNNPVLRYFDRSLSQLDSNAGQRYSTILADYPQGKPQGDWLVTKAVIETPFITFENNHVDFYLKFGGINPETRNVVIKSIDFTFTKKPLSFGNIFPKILKRLKIGT